MAAQAVVGHAHGVEHHAFARTGLDVAVDRERKLEGLECARRAAQPLVRPAGPIERLRFPVAIAHLPPQRQRSREGLDGLFRLRAIGHDRHGSPHQPLGKDAGAVLRRWRPDLHLRVVRARSRHLLDRPHGQRVVAARLRLDRDRRGRARAGGVDGRKRAAIRRGKRQRQIDARRLDHDPEELPERNGDRVRILPVKRNLLRDSRARLEPQRAAHGAGLLPWRDAEVGSDREGQDTNHLRHLRLPRLHSGRPKSEAAAGCGLQRRLAGCAYCRFLTPVVRRKSARAGICDGGRTCRVTATY